MAPNGSSRLLSGHDNPSTSRWRRNRSSANLLAAPTPENPTDTSSAPTLSRSHSRMSLFNLFSKPKVEKARGHTEVGLAVPMQPQQPPRPAPASPPKSSLRHNPPPQAQQVQRMRSSQMLRPMSMRSPSTKRPTDTDQWEPPPLFQAYPQAVKHATVQACSFSPDVLLRTQSQKKQAEMLRERMDSHRDLAATLQNGTEHRKLEKNHRRLNSVLNTAPQLTNKVYVLVTSGYVLQYSGDGPFDRLPEKVLKLGKDSAAFASDLIPGKHWVLQILQSANEDGTVTNAPKHSLLSRLRLQSISARRSAASFLLVMESAEEMKAWMTAVRKEIENFGGMKMSDESSRASSSIDETPELKSAEATTQRYLSQRDSNRLSKLMPIDSPIQSQYSESPKIVASDWEADRSEKTVSIVDTTSVYSSRHSTNRKSIEASSIATTAVSHEQVQLDQLRERSRYSYMSTATSVSGTGTRNTSRNSSPAPTSPLKEGFPPVEAEPLRSATSLRSFHMNPGNTTTRRRSMQPLPVTNEDMALSADTTAVPQRHSIYGPTSPTIREPINDPIREPMREPIRAPVREPIMDIFREPARHSVKLEPGVAMSMSGSIPPPTRRATGNARFSTMGQLENQNLVRYSKRSSSAPPLRISSISPPPRDPAPTPPTARPQSTIGNLSSVAARSNHSERRLSSAPKPFMRPIPVRPQVQNADGSLVVPRRFSSLAPPTGPAPLPLGIKINRAATAPVTPPVATTTAVAAAATTTPPRSQPNTAFQSAPPSQQLRRPTSVQIRSDPAPFLSSSRPVRAVSSTPSFVPGQRASLAPTTAPTTAPTPVPIAIPTPVPAVALTPSLHQSPSIPVLRGHGQQLTPPKNITPRRSMPAMSLPPPAPPPNMPLPPPPPIASHRAVAV